MKRQEYNISVENHGDSLYRFAVNFLKNQEEAQDIVQDVFEKLWINRDKVEFEKAKSWLFTCAHNAMINFINKRARFTKLSDEIQTEKVESFSFSFESTSKKLPHSIEYKSFTSVSEREGPTFTILCLKN